MIPPLAIIQARLHSSRLPHKMLLDLGGRPLLWWAWSAAVERFERDNVILAMPAADKAEFRRVLQLVMPDAMVFVWDGAEQDVLGRLYACASRNRTDLGAVIHRVTPDDVPAQLDRDWCSLDQLARWHQETTDPYPREHVGHLFHPEAPVEINTVEDLAYARRRLQDVQPD